MFRCGGSVFPESVCMEFTELKCPVCGLQFTENDDVVVCPDCGTAHHRACWQTLGHCACADSHGAEIPSQTVPHDDAPAEPETPVDAPVGDEAERPDPSLFADLSGKSLEDVVLNGVSGKMYYDAIGKNQEYYMPRFVLLSRVGSARIWNFFAFLCPGAWALYRKLYKWAAAFFAALFAMLFLLAVPVITDAGVQTAVHDLTAPYRNAATVEEQQQYAADFTAAYQYDSRSYAQLTAEQHEIYENMQALSKATAAVQNKTAYIIFYYAAYAVMFVVHVLFALRATRFYYSHLGKRLTVLRDVTPPELLTPAYVRRKNGVLPLWLAVLAGLLEFGLFL